jgi:hypothetical protein
MKPHELIRLSLEIENSINTDGDLVPLPEKDAVVLEVSRYPGGCSLFFHHGVPASVRAQITALAIETFFTQYEQVKQVLSQYAHCTQVLPAIGCYFAHKPAPAEFPDVVLHNGCYVVLVAQEPVSWAWTQDSSTQACELAVETVPAFQRRGYGRQVVAAWAAATLEAEKVAFYSYRIDNVASAALAHSLGVQRYAEKIAYS